MVAERYDVVVAGGGPAGSAASTTLAQRGYRVALFERERFPRFHIGESLLPGLWELWASLGVTQRLDDMGFPLKQGVNFSLPKVDHDIAFRTDEFPEYFPRPYAFHVDRARFDQTLLNHARHVGVEVYEGWSVEEVHFDGSRASGFTVKADDGTTHRVAASAGTASSPGACRGANPIRRSTSWHTSRTSAGRTCRSRRKGM